VFERVPKKEGKRDYPKFIVGSRHEVRELTSTTPRGKKADRKRETNEKSCSSRKAMQSVERSMVKVQGKSSGSQGGRPRVYVQRVSLLQR